MMVDAGTTFRGRRDDGDSVHRAALNAREAVSVRASADDDLLTTAEVAELVRAPISTVRYWRHIGSGPASFRVGRRVLYRRGDVRRWLDDMRLYQAGRQ